MEANKTQTAHMPVPTGRVAMDFMMLAGASVIAGLSVAAVASAFVILITGTG